MLISFHHCPSSQGPINKKHMTCHVHWHPLPGGIIKENVDDSSFGNLGKVDFGALLRNNMCI